ncbi:MAG: agmatine deiminase family protein, partial [Acidobacteriota bacterium]
MSINRRSFLASSATAIAMIGAPRVDADPNPDTQRRGGTWRMPDESHRHRRTWMAFGASTRIWGDLLPFVRADLARIANAIARYEPVTLLVRPGERRIAARLCDDAVELVDAPLDDLWIRDTGPTFVLDPAGRLGGVDLNFNGWGGKQEHGHDGEVARRVSRLAGARHLATQLVG